MQVDSVNRSDVDMSLAAKGHAPLGAFRHKTIWITGASQVNIATRSHSFAGIVSVYLAQLYKSQHKHVGPEQGLGKALALYFSRHGSRIILSARNEAALKVRIRLVSAPSSRCMCWLLRSATASTGVM